MKRNSFFFFSIVIFGWNTQAQMATEILVFDLTYNKGNYDIKNPINISNNAGYDNQPFFINEDEILFSSNNNGQTDIVKYSLKTQQKEWIINTSASEYSPTLTPKNDAISYIKLEENGTQLLWIVNLQNHKESILINDLKIGYHTWFDKNTLISFVLGTPNSLQISDIKNQTHQIVATQIGRSLHKIPHQKLICYVNKSADVWTVNSLNPKTGTTQLITEIPFQTEDLTWTPEGAILLTYKDTIFSFDFNGNKTWIEINSIKEFNLSGITRIAVSPNGKKIALVVQEK